VSKEGAAGGQADLLEEKKKEKADKKKKRKSSKGGNLTLPREKGKTPRRFRCRMKCYSCGRGGTSSCKRRY